MNKKNRIKKHNYLGKTRVELYIISKKERSLTIIDNLTSCDIDNFKNHFSMNLKQVIIVFL